MIKRYDLAVFLEYIKGSRQTWLNVPPPLQDLGTGIASLHYTQSSKECMNIFAEENSLMNLFEVSAI